MPVAISGVIGAAGLAFVLWQAWQVTTFLRHAVRAPGTIVDERQHQKIEFALPDGTRIVFTQNGFVDRSLGDPILVAYDSSDPAGTAVADTFFPLWWLVVAPLPGVLLFLGTALAGHRLEFVLRGGRS